MKNSLEIKRRENRRKTQRAYYILHRDKIRQRGNKAYAIYYKKNREKILEKRRGGRPRMFIRHPNFKTDEERKAWRKIKVAGYNKIKRKMLSKRQNIKYKSNIQYKLGCILRVRIKNILKNNKKIGSAVKDLGCTLGELKTHIEKQFTKGMNWDNWGKNGWHIEHINQLASFDLTNRKKFMKACNYKNLQPLWANDNLAKNRK